MLNEKTYFCKSLQFTVCCIILITILFSGCTNQISNQKNSIIHVGYSSNEFTSIQEAINHAKDGDRIQVASGIFYETLTINKSIQLHGSGHNVTIINGEHSYAPGHIDTITISANDCVVTDLRVTQGNTTRNARGIFIERNNTTITNITVQGFSEGIVLETQSSYATITHCILENNSYGIDTTSSIHNNISHNKFIMNSLYGVYLKGFSNNNFLSHNLFYKNDFAVRIKGSKQNEITENMFLNNTKGLYLCCGADDNLIYGNYFMNSTEFHAEEAAGNINFWNQLTPPIGNYWDDYTGSDNNGDGIGDTPYSIPNNNDEDQYPLLSVHYTP